MYLPKAKWRLIHTPAANGAWNMAVDEAILEAVGHGEVKPTLRLYAWSPPCLSLGYAQPFADVDIGRLKANDWQLVRRPTGGRAILHTDELTYSVIGPHSEPRLSGSVLESYQRISLGLLHALRSLGIPVEASEKKSGHPNQDTNNPVCFETQSNYEIIIKGKKIIGSAQARRRQGVLQHGSFPLHGDLTRVTQALLCPEDLSRKRAAKRLLERATTAKEVLGTDLTWDIAAQAFATGFCDALNLELIQAELTPPELVRVTELVYEKYSHPKWTQKVC